jgi:uncharacterized Tic20 family protein
MEVIDPENTNNIPGKKPWGMEMSSFLVLFHLSQLAGLLVPYAGLVLPLVMWLTNREDFPEVDRHGKMIINWLISLTIYLIVAAILSFLLIGLPLLIILALLALIFPIIGGIKAGNGELWHYPLTIEFIK